MLIITDKVKRKQLSVRRRRHLRRIRRGDYQAAAVAISIKTKIPKSQELKL